MTQCAEILSRATILCGDFETVVLRFAKGGDFVYLDPPFYRTDVRTFRQYNAEPFGASDLKRLTDLLEELRRRKCSFLLSYAYCDEVKPIFYSAKKIVPLIQLIIAMPGGRGTTFRTDQVIG